jgi:DNA-binding HxlR family transcriptional regulator
MTRQFRSGCPIASMLDMVGDRWSLIILRDLICGKTRFSQFLDSPERITPSVLTDRLTFLEADGLIFRRSYSERPKRYEFFLTQKGEALLPVMQAICAWGHAHVPGTWEAPRSFMERIPDSSGNH